MRYVLVALLIVLFGYSLALVLQMGPSCRLTFVHSSSSHAFGVIVITDPGTGCCCWTFTGCADFPVFQTSWEIKRLRKDIDHLRKEQIHTAQLAAAEAAANTRHEKQW